MLLTAEMGTLNDEDTRHPFTRKWTLIVCLCCLLVFIIVTYLGDAGRGRAAAISVGTLLMATRLYWDNRDQLWFWTGTAAIVALHTYLVIAFHWTNHSYPGPSLLPIALLDYGVDCGFLKIAKVLVRTRRA